MNQEDINRLRELHEAATPGPWIVYGEPEVNLPYSLFAGSPMVSGFAPLEGSRGLSGVDMELIATMRNALPTLIAEAERAKLLEVALLTVEERADYASGQIHDSTEWPNEPAPDGRGTLWEWVFATALEQNGTHTDIRARKESNG